MGRNYNITIGNETLKNMSNFKYLGPTEKNSELNLGTI